MVARYRDFGWGTPDPANGSSGAGLADSVIKVIERLDDAERICDLGCGNGYLAGRLSELGYQVTGIDASPSGIEVATNQYPNVKFLCSPIEDSPRTALNEAVFDLVVSSDVIEHLYRPSVLLETGSVLLKPGGHLVIGTPYHGYLKNLALSITGRMDPHFTALWDGGHIKFFSVRTLSQLIKQQGFRDLTFSFYGRAPYLWKNMICHARKSGKHA
ncbi:MAG: methyltransferase domain-containing protein [Acidobacteriota bacterium]